MSVAKAKNDLRLLDEQVEKLTTQIHDIESQRLKLLNYIEISESYGEISEPNRGRDTPIDHRQHQERGTLSPERSQSIPRNVRAVISILKQAGKPLPTRELVERLKDRGIIIGGKIPTTGLSSALSRHKNLLRPDRSEGWSLILNSESNVEFTLSETEVRDHNQKQNNNTPEN